MPVTFPVVLTSYFENAGKLMPTTRTFRITDPRSYNETKGGDGIVTGYGYPLWYGKVSVVPLHHALQRPLEARARFLTSTGAEFYIGDLMEDPIGQNPTISAFDNTTSSTLSLAGLTPGYVVRTGTRMSFNFSGRRALHEAVNDATANASGVASSIEVWPPIQPGLTVGAAVAMGGNARCKATLLPGTLEEGVADANMSEGFTFAWRQTLR